MTKIFIGGVATQRAADFKDTPLHIAYKSPAETEFDVHIWVKAKEETRRSKRGDPYCVLSIMDESKQVVKTICHKEAATEAAMEEGQFYMVLGAKSTGDETIAIYGDTVTLPTHHGFDISEPHKFL